MRHQLLSKQYISPTLLIIALGVGVLLGAASVWVPILFLLIGIAGVIYLKIAWSWPEIAILFILVMSSTILDPFDRTIVPAFSIGVGTLYITDVLFFVLIGIIILRSAIESNSLTYTPLYIPLFAFYITAILSTVIALLNSSISFNQSLGELRIVNFYLSFFLVTNLVRTEKQFSRLYNGIIFLTTFVAAAMILQYVLGPSVRILPGRVERLGTAGVASFGVTRILPPGQSLVMFGLVCLVVQMLFDKKSPRFILHLIQIGVIGFAVILTFNRNFWMAIALALLLVGLLLSLREKIKYVQVIFTVLIGVSILTPFLSVKGSKTEELVNGIVLRMSSIFSPDVSKESSLLYRDLENSYAYPQIASHPLIGLGLGANFRPWNPGLVGADYIHNGHLYLMLKTGLIGYLSFMLFLLIFVKRGFQYWKQIPNPLHKGIVLSSATGVIGIMAAAFVNPIFMQPFWTPVIGIMLAMSDSIIRTHQDQSSTSPFLGKLN